ncbi:MAG: hypothetical protein ABSE39_01785 [Candidatus Bathyarchaeia archaeon]|jgi:hypothetical protein
MTKREVIRKHESSILKGIAVISLLVLIVLGSTLVMVRFLRTNPRTDIGATGWQQTPEVRIIMDSTADWARMMFNDLYGTDSNGIRIVDFHSHGWLLGNDSNYRIDAARGLTFLDIIYNSTVMKTGDIIGFFKGNNDFRHTRMFADVILEVNFDMTRVSVYLMLAGAGTTTFQFINKETGVVLWEDTETGRSVTQYLPRYIFPQVFYAKEKIDTYLVLALLAGTILTIILLNPMYLPRPAERRSKKESGGL